MMESTIVSTCAYHDRERTAPADTIDRWLAAFGIVPGHHEYRARFRGHADAYMTFASVQARAEGRLCRACGAMMHQPATFCCPACERKSKHDGAVLDRGTDADRAARMTRAVSKGVRRHNGAGA
jgi:hypothetical protein